MTMNPSAINSGRVLLVQPTELPSKIGKRGRMHGAPTVSIPARMAKRISIIDAAVAALFNVLFQCINVSAIPLGDHVTTGINLYKGVLIGDAVFFL